MLRGTNMQGCSDMTCMLTQAHSVCMAAQTCTQCDLCILAVDEVKGPASIVILLLLLVLHNSSWTWHVGMGVFMLIWTLKA